MSVRLRLNLEYDGSRFAGWQVQPDAVTVQGEVERALTAFYGGREVRIMGSGRTDAGVHAVGQVAHGDVPESRDPAKILAGVNSLLPEGIRLWRTREVDPEFHARYQARERVYGYRLLDEPGIFANPTGWVPNFKWDVERAKEASQWLTGSHDFWAFSTKPDHDENPVCELRDIRWQRQEEGWLVQFVADRYLRRMVRTLVGTLVWAGAGRIDKEQIEAHFERGEGRAPVPAPAHGLALLRVRYDGDDEGDRPGPSPWGVIA